MKRRSVLLVLAAAVLSPGHALAAPVTVEIIAMAHPPVVAALKPLRSWLAGQATKVTLVELDAGSASVSRRLAGLGLHGHVPVVVLIDGRYRYTLKDGRTVAFVNFPDIDAAPPAVRGNWTTADVQAVLADRLR